MTQLALGQLQDDFTDGDFTAFPPWHGDEPLFVVTEKQLKLNAPATDGNASLSANSALAQNASWEFEVKLMFNPSSGNYARVYLIADNVDLSSSLNGYFVSIGETKDEISLYRQTDGASSKIIDGHDGVLNLPTVSVKVRITRDVEAGWQLFTDVGPTGTYTQEGTSPDNTYLESNYFGLHCTYTSTRSDKFFFDNFYVVQNVVIDETPPALTGLEIMSPNELKLVFSEALAETSAVKIENYAITPAGENPKKAALNADLKTVILNFENRFPENTPVKLSVSGLTDMVGNEMKSTTRELIFIPPVVANSKDIIITEIFSDPSPVIGLPESEFVEIFNRSEHALNLSSWKFTDQSAVSVLPDHILLPQEYVILAADTAAFSAYGKVLHLKNFPSLNNTSDVLILKDANDVTVDSVKYFDTWYRDDDKKSGGWTLEIIDPDNVCSEHENWIASEDATGGTPGKRNSVFASKPDLTAPRLISAIPINASLVQLQFDEKLEKQLPSAASFTTTPILDLNGVVFSDPTLTQLHLSLTSEMQSGVTYSILAENIYDCAGNVISSQNSISFGLPENADSLEIQINEILFNPKPTGVDFVEIINTSSKFINLKHWAIANIDDGLVLNKKVLTEGDVLFPPGGILAITERPETLKGEYLLSDEKTFLRMADMPGFNDDRGSVALINPEGNVIDFFVYSDEMHSIFIKDNEGVSLERISIRPANDEQNWKSASSSAGYATPGYQNSNSLPETTITAEVLKVEPEIFDPLAGHPDFTQIHYNFEKGGFVASVKIFDSQGRLIKEIANNDILGATGFYRWDGDRNDGTKAPIGYYMVWFEIFDETGTVRTFQRRIAIATAF